VFVGKVSTQMLAKLLKVNDSKLSRLTKYSSTVCSKKEDIMENKISVMYVAFILSEHPSFLTHIGLGTNCMSDVQTFIKQTVDLKLIIE
jgi:hypothetical protein